MGGGSFRRRAGDDRPSPSRRGWTPQVPRCATLERSWRHLGQRGLGRMANPGMFGSEHPDTAKPGLHLAPAAPGRPLNMDEHPAQRATRNKVEERKDKDHGKTHGENSLQAMFALALVPFLAAHAFDRGSGCERAGLPSATTARRLVR